MEMMSKESYINKLKDLCINDFMKEKEILKSNILNNNNLFFDNKETKRDIELENLEELNNLIDEKIEEQEINTYGSYITVIHTPFQSAYGRFDDLIINRQNKQKINYIVEENKIIDLVKFKINVIDIKEEYIVVKFENKKTIESAASNPENFNKEFSTDAKTFKILNNVEYQFNLKVYDTNEKWKLIYINIFDINKIIKKDIQDPFFADVLIKYFNELNISNNEIMQKYNIIKSDEKVLNDFIKYIMKRNFDFDTNLIVNGKTAKQIFDENPNMNGLEVYLNLISRNNNKKSSKDMMISIPPQLIKYIYFKKGILEHSEDMPADLISLFEKTKLDLITTQSQKKDELEQLLKVYNDKFLIKVTEKIGVPTKQITSTELYIDNDDIVIDNIKLNKSYDKIELLNIISRALPRLQKIKKQQTEEFLGEHICYNNSIKQMELTIKDKYILLNMQTSTETDKFLRALVNELIQLIYN